MRGQPREVLLGLALGLSLAVSACGGSDTSSTSRESDGVEAVPVNQTSESANAPTSDAETVVLVASSPQVPESTSTTAAAGVKPSSPHFRPPPVGPVIVSVHQGRSGLLAAGHGVQARAWVLRSQVAWRKLWSEHLLLHPESPADAPVADFRSRMVVGVATWGGDATGRVEIQSVVRLGSVMRVVFKVVGRCPEDATFEACRRDVVPVHRFVAVPQHVGTVQFVMASADEPEMSWTSRTCAAQRMTWTVGQHECTARVEETGEESARVVSHDRPDLWGSATFYCRRNDAGALWWTPWLASGLRGVSCAPPPPPPPPPAEPLEIATANNCMVCHTVDSGKVVGPSFKRVADFYRNSPPAQGELERKIKQGGTGVFGSVPMPANPQISDTELAIVVPWILGLQ